MKKRVILVVWLSVILLLVISFRAGAHCDTMDGPVIAAAKAALAKGDVTPILKWVQKGEEQEIRDLFKKTLAVRIKGKDAQELADRYFFESLVRIHRAGEGEPYTGLKPAGQVEPSIAAADKAIESGSGDALVRMMNDAAAAGLKKRYAAVVEAKKHADESVDAGRKFVAAYVDFTHYVEKLDQAAAGGNHHQGKADVHKEHGAAGEPETEIHQQHH